MQTQQPNFYAIIPANVRYDAELSSTAKILYGEITALASKDGYCFAGNRYFEELYKMSERSVSRILKQLCDRGYIFIQDGDGKKRRIYISDGVTPTKMSINIDKNVGVNPDKNVGQNNTSNNNIKNNKKDYTEEFENWYSSYPNKWNKQQTYKNYLTALKTHTASELTAARDAYISYIRQSGTSAQYVTRSTNFLGKKGEYIGWLERIGQADAPPVTQGAADDESTAELIRRRKEMLKI